MPTPAAGPPPTPDFETLLLNAKTIKDMKMVLSKLFTSLSSYCDATNKKINNLFEDNAIKEGLVNTLLADKENLTARVIKLEAVHPCTHGNVMDKIDRLTSEVAKLQSIVHTRKPLLPTLTLGSPAAQQSQTPGLLPSMSPQANNVLNQTGSAPAQTTGNGAAQTPVTSVSVATLPAQRHTGRENETLQQPHSSQQVQNNTNGIKRGPKKVDQIFISQVHQSYKCENLIAHIHDSTRIDRDEIQVNFLFNKNGNQAFKITVPNGKMKETIRILGTNIKAEPFKEKHQRSTKVGHASRAGWSNPQRRFNNYNNNDNNTFPGPHSYRRHPTNRQPYINGRQPYWNYESPEWDEYGYPLHY